MNENKSMNIFQLEGKNKGKSRKDGGKFEESG